MAYWLVKGVGAVFSEWCELAEPSRQPTCIKSVKHRIIVSGPGSVRNATSWMFPTPIDLSCRIRPCSELRAISGMSWRSWPPEEQVFHVLWLQPTAQNHWHEYRAAAILVHAPRVEMHDGLKCRPVAESSAAGLLRTEENARGVLNLIFQDYPKRSSLLVHSSVLRPILDQNYPSLSD